MKGPSHIGNDFIPGDLCLTLACHRQPVKATLYCESCWEKIEEEHWRDSADVEADRQADAMRDEAKQ